MTYPEYQAALKQVLATYRSVPKTPDSVEAYQTQTQAIHAEYKASKLAPGTPAAEKIAEHVANKQYKLDKLIAAYETKLLKLQEELKMLQDMVDLARHSKRKAALATYEGGDARRQSVAECLQRAEEALKSHVAIMALHKDPRKYGLDSPASPEWHNTGVIVNIKKD